MTLQLFGIIFVIFLSVACKFTAVTSQNEIIFLKFSVVYLWPEYFHFGRTATTTVLKNILDESFFIIETRTTFPTFNLPCSTTFVENSNFSVKWEQLELEVEGKGFGLSVWPVSDWAPPTGSIPTNGRKPTSSPSSTDAHTGSSGILSRGARTNRSGGEKQRARAGWGGKLSGPKLRNRVHSANGRSSYKNFFLRFRSMVQLQGGGQWRCSSRNVSAMLGDDGGFNPVWWAGSEDWRSGFCAAPL